MSLDMIPTHYPIEDILEAYDYENNDEISLSVLNTEQLRAYIKDDFDFIDDANVEIDGLIYDIEEEISPHEAIETIFVHTDSVESPVALLQPTDKVRKTWYSHLENLDNKVDPIYASDSACYTIEKSIKELRSNIIQATLISSHYDTDYETLIRLDSSLATKGQTLNGLDIHIIVDTGAHKTILNRRFLRKHSSIFQNFQKIPLAEEHKIKLGSGQIIYTDGLLALPLVIQGHYFQFLVLVATLAEDYELVLGLESLLQLECTLSLPDCTLFVRVRSIPLYLHKDITLGPQDSQVIFLTGDLPIGFSSGTALIYVLPLDTSLSAVTVEAEFINQYTCFSLSNRSDNIHTFSMATPFAYLDTRSLGYYAPPMGTDIFRSYTITYPETTQFAALISDTSQNYDTIPDTTVDTKDPYPWLDLDDVRRFQTDRQILEQKIDLSESCLSAQEKHQFYDLLTDYSDVFSLRDEIGLAPEMKVELEMLDKTPFFIRPFTVKEDMKPKIDKEMTRLEILGILKKGLSGYSSPAMPIPRKNSDIPRIVADFRHLNTKLLQLNMSFPLVKECISQIGASQCEVMSVIDLRDAYHTLRLSPVSQQYCGITPYYGSDTYLYQRLPMGLKVSPAIWQAFINKVLGPIPHRERHIAIMDDCLVHSKRIDHWADIANLLESLRHHGLKISPRKCQFFRISLIYMGYKFLIDNGKPSFTPMKDKCEAIRALETPKTVRDCRKFCGMVNFLAIFLPELQKHLIPIYNVTKKNRVFEWTEDCQKSFDIIKQLLIKPPVLRMPNSVGLYTLVSDTSTIATGAVLYQEQGLEKKKYIVGYNSKKLPSAAKSYSITELELFGLVINIHAFTHQLTGVYFECYCDHSALTYILNSKRKINSIRLDRLVRDLIKFNFSIYYLPGTKMHIADVLSRLAGRDLDPPDKVFPICFNAMKSLPPRRQLPQRNRRPPQHILYTADKHKPSQLPSFCQAVSPSQITKQNIVPSRPKPRSSSTPAITRNKQNTSSRSFTPSSSQMNTDLSEMPSQEVDVLPLTPPSATPPQRNQETVRFPLQQRRLLFSPPRSLTPPPRRLNAQNVEDDRPPRSTLVNPFLDIPHTLPPVDLPPPQEQSLETYRQPEEHLRRQPLPILKDSKELDVFAKHIPKQKEIDEFLKVLKAKVIHSYALPILASEIQRAYQTSPAFKHIYQYITTNMLPSNKRAQRSIITNAENYIVADGLLFRLQETMRNRHLVRRCLLVIPESHEHIVFHQYHDSLLGAHYGPLNTFYTIRDKYYIHNLFEKVNRYVYSCSECQQQKSKKNKDKYFHPRIPLSYNPMAYLSADIKYMPKGIYDYEYLLVLVCEITGFIIAIPLIKHDAVTISHALLDRVIFIFGPPKTLIIDEDRALSSKVMHYILDALKINTKIISPHNHGSLKTERYIQTINNLITRQLTGKGKEWPLFVMSTCYAMNTFVSPVTGFSPYELVFLKKPPDLLNLYFQPLETVAKDFREYCVKMKARLNEVATVVMEMKSQQQQRQAELAAARPEPLQTFQEDQLVYLLAPSASSLKTKTRKCIADFVGPLVISRVLDSTHYVLSDLQGCILVGVYHINRLKAAHVRTPSGVVSTYSQLRVAFQNISQEEANGAALPDATPAALLQSVYNQPVVHRCSNPYFNCTCILDLIPHSD